MANYQCRGKKKLWSVRFTIIEDGLEVQKRLSGFPRKKDAESAYMDFMQEYEKTDHIKLDTDIKHRIFQDVFEEYLAYKKERVKDSSYYEISKTAEKHILPYFSDYKIKDITKPVVLNWQMSLANYSYKYKSKIRYVLYSCFKYLQMYYDIENIVSKIEPFKKPKEKKEMEIWTLDEFNKFINTFENDIIYKTFFTFLYYTGCRLGESLALTYNDFNFRTNKVKINKSITTKVSDNSSTFAVTTPKNETSFREILLPDVLIKQLKSYINEIPESKNSNFFFGLDKPLDDHTIYRRLDKHSRLAEVKKIRIHDFRHSHVSLLIEHGANIVLIAKRVGHSDTQQTLNTYSHLFPNSEQDLIKKINALK